MEAAEMEAVSTRQEAREALSRKEKRKGRKKAKRSEKRQQAAEQARQEEEFWVEDPVVQEQEARALEQERIEHELQERLWLEREKEAQEEADRLRREAEEAAEQDANAWDYVEEGPAEIIWEGNEIIVRKKKVKVPKSRLEKEETTEDVRPVSNPLLPESLYCKPISSSLPSQNAAYEDHKKLTHSAILSNTENNPNFGTEQDKTHCPFHIKTGVCRFGVNCSRAHVSACLTLMWRLGATLSMRPGRSKTELILAYTDEEVVQSYKEFFEDVHGEFSKHGEIVNFKVCRNESSHLRGNVYAQFGSVDSAVTAYNALNGRFYAGKQITCEFVVLTRWRAALCGEYMRSHHRVCSHGTACNFLHCFKNPGGLYDWADWDNPPPRSHSGKSHRSWGNSNEDVFRHERDKYSHSRRSHRENSSYKSKRSDQSYGKHESRFQHCYGRSSSEENSIEEKVRSHKERRHRISDRIRDEDHQTERKKHSRKHRRRSRSRDRNLQKLRNEAEGHKQRTRRDATGRTSSRRRGRSTSHESPESVLSSDRGSAGETRSSQRHRRRDRSDDRYRLRSRSPSPEQRREDEVLTGRKRSRSSSDE